MINKSKPIKKIKIQIALKLVQVFITNQNVILFSFVMILVIP